MFYDPTEDPDWKYGMAVMNYFRHVQKTGTPPGTKPWFECMRARSAVLESYHRRRRDRAEDGDGK